MILPDDLDFQTETAKEVNSQCFVNENPNPKSQLGVFKDMSNAEYHASKAISKSGLDALAKTPAHLWYYQQQGSRSSKAKDFGSVFHDVTLMGVEFTKPLYPIEPDFNKRSAAGREEYQQWLSLLASNQTPITHEEWEMALAMRDSVLMNPYARWLIEEAQKEMACENSHFWVDDETFIYCRVRPDIKLISKGILGDLKSTLNCTPAEFSKSIYDYRYHVQDAMYCDGVQQTESTEISDFWFIATEKKASRPVTVAYRLDEAARNLGRALYRRDLNHYAQLLEQDDFTHPVEIDLPYYAYK